MAMVALGACQSQPSKPPAAPRAESPAAPAPPAASAAPAASAVPAVSAASAVAQPQLSDAAPRNYPGIHNAVAYHPGFVSGSAPEGAEGFATLRAMGVKTVISVDGAAPDAALAQTYGLRYVHLPIGYNGFDEARKAELVRATRDAMRDGPVYIHCHHGKHRSAGAAAAVAASMGWMTPQEAVARMKVSGTAPDYKGLYACAAGAQVMSAAAIDLVPANFPAVAAPEGFVKSMVQVDEAMESLKAIQKASWGVPADHPDLVPVAVAGQLADLLRVLPAGDRAHRQGTEFALALQQCADLAQHLEDALAAKPMDPQRVEAQFKALNTSCKDCHARFRD